MCDKETFESLNALYTLCFLIHSCSLKRLASNKCQLVSYSHVSTLRNSSVTRGWCQDIKIINTVYDLMSSTPQAVHPHKLYESITQTRALRVLCSALTFNHGYQLHDYKCHDGNSFPIALLKKTLHRVHLQLLLLADRHREREEVLFDINVVPHFCSCHFSSAWHPYNSACIMIT